MTTRCEDCGKGKGPVPFEYRFADSQIIHGVYQRIEFCPVCAGKLMSGLIAYFKERTRLGLRGPRRAKDAKKPLRVMGAWRCRRCEVQLKDYRMGDSPVCDECR